MGNRACPFQRASYRSDTSCVGENSERFRLPGGNDGPNIDEFADQIIIMRFGNPESPELSGSGVAFTQVVDVTDAIDLGRLRGHAALPEQVDFFGRPIQEHGELLADEFAVFGA